MFCSKVHIYTLANSIFLSKLYQHCKQCFHFALLLALFIPSWKRLVYLGEITQPAERQIMWLAQLYERALVKGAVWEIFCSNKSDEYCLLVRIFLRRPNHIIFQIWQNIYNAIFTFSYMIFVKVLLLQQRTSSNHLPKENYPHFCQKEVCFLKLQRIFKINGRKTAEKKNPLLSLFITCFWQRFLCGHCYHFLYSFPSFVLASFTGTEKSIFKERYAQLKTTKPGQKMQRRVTHWFLILLLNE